VPRLPAAGDHRDPRHHAAYCAEDFVDHVRAQVRAAIAKHRMLSYDDRILVAVSGGKDSLALWDVLLDMGYRADGLYLGLGIGGYSDRSGQIVPRLRRAARARRCTCVTSPSDYGFDIPLAATSAEPVLLRGVRAVKRYVFNQVALEGGYDVMATGHNLDDEAATLLGNVLRWQTPFLARQSVACRRPRMARKVKPLYRLGEREMAAYCVIKGIDYVVEECPMVGGNTVLRYKDALNELERPRRGRRRRSCSGSSTVASRPRALRPRPTESAEVVPCSRCDAPTTALGGKAAGEEPVCAFCRTRGRLLSIVERREAVDAGGDRRLRVAGRRAIGAAAPAYPAAHDDHPPLPRPPRPAERRGQGHARGPQGAPVPPDPRRGPDFHFHGGIVRHDDLIGQPEGTRVRSTKGQMLLAVRPTSADWTVKAPRGAQVVYPKDQAMIVQLADVCPGATVVEAGAGSGALTMALLRAVGPAGRVLSFELREDHAEVAVATSPSGSGGSPQLGAADRRRRRGARRRALRPAHPRPARAGRRRPRGGRGAAPRRHPARLHPDRPAGDAAP
jgi:tRNA-5-methyluridine54 2-sulfurtransferase